MSIAYTPLCAYAGLQPGAELLCKRCERFVPIKLRTPTQAECSVCNELLFDVEEEAERHGVTADEGEL